LAIHTRRPRHGRRRDSWLETKLKKFLHQFHDCFGRKDTREHLSTYVEGQLSKLDRKSVEPIALAAGVAPRRCSSFLNSLEWDQEQLIDTLQWRVARDHTSAHAIGLIDETSCPKKGGQDARCAAAMVRGDWQTGQLRGDGAFGLRVDDFHCLLDSQLFLSESWSEDRARCRAAHIPDEMVYRPEMADRPGVVRPRPPEQGLVRLSDIR